MIRKIVSYPSPVLSRASKPIETVDDSIRALLSDMAETMYVADGVGLAAPQIDAGLRAIVVDVGGEPGLLKMVNPEIVSREGEIEWEEGCLSVPEFRIVIKRSRRVHVRYLDENSAVRELDAEDLLAVAIQHEIDHLDGKLIVDNVSRLKRELYVKKRKKAEEHARESIVL
ncbi:MAG: peptide deformylase [bacterium]